jgi:hypothetical protein
MTNGLGFSKSQSATQIFLFYNFASANLKAISIFLVRMFPGYAIFMRGRVLGHLEDERVELTEFVKTTRQRRGMTVRKAARPRNWTELNRAEGEVSEGRLSRRVRIMSSGGAGPRPDQA